MAEEGTRKGIIVSDSFLDAVALAIIGLFLVQLLFSLPDIYAALVSSSFLGLDTVNWFAIYRVIFAISIIFSVIFIAGSVYAWHRHEEVVKAEKRALDRLTRDAISSESTENTRWKKVLSYAASDDTELWRLAIIEADVMMDEMLAQMGYTQSALGEKLRSVERADFYTIDEAWDAHKVRNSIAHEGSSYDLTRRELESTIDKYRKVFREFSYV